MPARPLPVVAALGGLLLTTVWLPSALADRLEQTLPLNSAAQSEVERPGDVATIGFLASAGTGRKLSLAVKAAKGSPLQPDVRLLAPDGTLVPLAGRVKGASFKAKLADLDHDGLYRLEVRGNDGSAGAFSVQVKGREGGKVAGSALVPAGGSLDVPFTVGANAEVTIKAKRQKGAAVVPQLRIVDPTGTLVEDGALLGTVNEKSGSLKLAKYRLSLSGEYRLRFSGKAGTGGTLSYAVTSKTAKSTDGLPTANPGPAREVEPGLAASLDGSASGGGLGYRWRQVGGPPVELLGRTTATPSFVAPQDTSSLAFELVVLQGKTPSAASVVGVEVAERPLAHAGRSLRVAPGADVTLDGTGSRDRRGTGLLHAWRQIPGDAVAVALTGADTATPSFVAPGTDAVLHFGLVVDDGRARSFEDVVVVAVGSAPLAVADAGREQYVPRMTTVHLSGLGSVPAGPVLDGAFAWTQVSGPPVELDSADTPFPSFTSPRTSADLVFELVHGGEASTADRVSVRVRPGEDNLPHAARSNGPLASAPGAVQLAGDLVGDPDNDPLEWRWAQVAGPPLAISATEAPKATTTLVAGTHVAQFAVQAWDGLQYGAPDRLTLYELATQGFPLASAGPDRVVASGNPFALDARASARTDGGSGLTYRWTQVSGTDWFDVEAALPSFDPTAANQNLTLPPDVSSLTPRRTISFAVVVSDGTNESLPDLMHVTITGLPLNGKPQVTAATSEDNPLPGSTVTLVGTATDRDGDPVSVNWTQTEGPPVQLQPGRDALSPQFICPGAGTLSFTLIGNDGFDDSAPAVVGLVIDEQPTAVIDTDPLAGSPGTLVTLDGTGSSDPEGRPLTYRWTQTGGPAVAFDEAASSFQFNAPDGVVSFSLVVNDGRQDSNTATTSFSSNIPPVVAPTASRSKAAYGASVTLQANATGTGTLTYQWRQLTQGSHAGDPIVALSSTTSANPVFTAPLPTSSPFGGSSTSLPSATFGVRATSGTVSSEEKLVTVEFFASFNDSAQTSTQNTVYGIIGSNCTGCHSGSSSFCPVGSGNNAQGFGMGTASAFRSNAIGVASCGSKSSRVTTGNSGASYLVSRLKGTGGSMPPTGSLPLSDINLIQDWIDQGTQDN